jgi:hypothetical protein
VVCSDFGSALAESDEQRSHAVFRKHERGVLECHAWLSFGAVVDESRFGEIACEDGAQDVSSDADFFACLEHDGCAVVNEDLGCLGDLVGESSHCG